MKGSLIVLALLLFAACESSVTYQDIKYTNSTGETGKTVKFWTAENNCPDGYELPVGASMSLPSDVRGRTQISSIETPLVTWEYNEDNVYDIRFVKVGRSLEIRNYSQDKVIVKEKNGFISKNNDEWPVVEVKIGPRHDEDYKAVNNLKLYTKKPVWIIEPPIRFELKEILDESDEVKYYILGIKPPWDDDEWYKK